MKSKYMHLTDLVYMIGAVCAAFMLGFMFHETMVEAEVKRIKKILSDE